MFVVCATRLPWFWGWVPLGQLRGVWRGSAASSGRGLGRGEDAFGSRCVGISAAWAAARAADAQGGSGDVAAGVFELDARCRWCGDDVDGDIGQRLPGSGVTEWSGAGVVDQIDV